MVTFGKDPARMKNDLPDIVEGYRTGGLRDNLMLQEGYYIGFGQKLEFSQLQSASKLIGLQQSGAPDAPKPTEVNTDFISR